MKKAMNDFFKNPWLKRHNSWVAISPKGKLSEIEMESTMNVSKWEIFKPAHRSKFSKYDNQNKVIVSGNRIILTMASFKQLDYPAHVQVAIDAVHERIGIIKVTSPEDAYKINKRSSGTYKNEHPFIYVKALLDRVGLKNNRVYDAYREGDWLVVDINSPGSVL